MTFEPATEAQLILAAETAADLMMPNPVTISALATLQEAIALLSSRRISAAPVVDDSGRPVGVLSRADIVSRLHQSPETQPYSADYFADWTPEPHEPSQGHSPGEASGRVCDVMSPIVRSIEPHTPAAKVVERMLALNLHRIFVVDHAGTLVGIISSLNIVRHLQPHEALAR